MNSLATLKFLIKKIFNVRTASRLLVSVAVAILLVIHTEPQDLKIIVRLKGFIPAVVYTTLGAFIISEYIHLRNYKLNSEYPWEKGYLKRILIQVTQCVIVPLGLAFCCASFYFGIYGLFVLDTPWFGYYFLPIALIIIILNLILLVAEAFRIISTSKTPAQFASESSERLVFSNEFSGQKEYFDSILDKDVAKICYIKSYTVTRVAFLKNNEQLTWPHPIDQSLTYLEVGKYLIINRTEIIEKTNICATTQAMRIFFLTLKVPIGTVVKVSQRHSDIHRAFFEHQLLNSNNKR